MLRLTFLASGVVAGCALISAAAIAADLYIPSHDDQAYADPDPAGAYGSNRSDDVYGGSGIHSGTGGRNAKQSLSTGYLPGSSSTTSPASKAAADLKQAAANAAKAASDTAKALGSATAGALSTHTKPATPGSPATSHSAAAEPSTTTPSTTPEGLLTKPASADDPHKAGTLTCNVATGIGLIIGSTKKLDCTFTGEGREPEHYTGHIDVLGVDIGVTGKSTTTWNVLAPNHEKLAPGSLAGTFTGASAEATAGVGVGGKVLVSGNGNGVKLQPISVQNQSGLDIAGGVTAVTLNYAAK